MPDDPRHQSTPRARLGWRLIYAGSLLVAFCGSYLLGGLFQ